ncbi:MAG: biopolymer transport protein ExbB [Oleiphilaceae bacterium]|jgi:biopolymer transport protein ExbB
MQLSIVQQFEPLLSIQHFLMQGGWVLWLIALVAFLVITLAAERMWFLLITYCHQYDQHIVHWRLRSDTGSWCAHRIREAILSNANRELSTTLPIIKVLIMICPMLGLLGTVTGMISVFEVMAFNGTGNARLMAAGISKATIPTMAGMFVAIIGLLLTIQLERMITSRHERLATALSI